MTSSILIVDDNKMTRDIVAQTLNSQEYELFFAKSGLEALDIANSALPNLVILDIGLPDIDGYLVCQNFRMDIRFAKTPIIMLTGYTDLDNRLKAFAAGADDYIQKPFHGRELQARVKLHLRRFANTPAFQPRKTESYKIAVYSLRGGIGVSTIAVNLSVGLALLWDAPTLLTDLALVNGQDALMLNINLRNTWTNLAKIKLEEIDQELINKVVLHHSSGLYLIAAPTRSEEAEVISEKHVKKLFEVVSDSYRYIVMDLPHDFSPTTLAGLDTADVILLIVSPDLASVRCASNALNVFRGLGYSDEKVQMVMNWNIGEKGLAQKEIEKVLHKSFSAVIPYLNDAPLMAITLGKPSILESEKPEAALLEDLAYFWSRKEDKELIPALPTPALRRVNDRAKHRQTQLQN